MLPLVDFKMNNDTIILSYLGSQLLISITSPFQGEVLCL